MMLCKQKAYYVKACIIANGITDSQGDTLYAEDIKKIFTSFNNQDNFEVHHNNLPLKEVSLLENYISTADETIGTAIAPAGSWMAVIRVDNPKIQERLLNGEFGGVSLYNRVDESCKGNLKGIIRYDDIDAECVIPLFISFVKKGANGYGLHVMDYPAYIQKSDNKQNGVKKMAFNLLDGLKSLIKQAEDEGINASEPVIVKEEEPNKEEEVVIVKEDNKEEEDEDETNQEEDEVEIKKEEEDDFEARVIAIIEKVLAEKNKEKNESDDEPETNDEQKEDTPKIVKSSKVVVTQENNTINTNNYYELTGRDPLTGLPLKK